MNDTADDSSRWEIIGQKGQWQIRHINPCSDGEQRQWPGKPYRPSSEERYLIQLGKAWVEKDGLQMPGKSHSLNRQRTVPQFSALKFTLRCPAMSLLVPFLLFGVFVNIICSNNSHRP